MTEDELLTLAQASKLVGRSIDSLRRWRRDGILVFEGEDAKGRALVRRQALLLAAQSHAKDTASTPPQTRAHTQAGSEALEAVRAHLADVQGERDRWQGEAERLRTELLSERTMLADMKAKLAAIEKEMNGGVRGLLLRRFRG